MIICVQILLGPALLKFRKGTSKIQRDFGQFQTLIVNVSGNDRNLDKRKTALSSTIYRTFDEKD